MCNRRLIEHDLCPWCQGRNRQRVFDVDPRPNRYSLALEAEAEIEKGALSSVDTYQCSDCRTVYMGQFFHPNLVLNTFLRRTSSHNAGWRSFHSKTGLLPKSALLREHQKSQAKLDIIRMISPMPEMYVVVGCPFTGIAYELLYPANDSRVFREKYYQFLSDALPQNEAAFAIFNGGGPRSLLSFSGRLFLFLLKLERKLLFLLRKTRRQFPPLQSKRFIYFIKPESRFIWGGNCTSNFSTCNATALTMYGMQQVRLDEVSELSKEKKVMFGFFNTLDHQENPREILEACMAIGDTLIETHGRKHGGGRQHLFFLDETIPAWCELKGWHCKDLTEDVSALHPTYGNHLFLLRRI